MTKPKFLIEVHEHGVVLLSAPGELGLPFDALNIVEQMMPNHAIMAFGVAHHYKAMGKDSVVTAVSESEQHDKQWEAEIKEHIAGSHYSKEDQWWRGVDVGLSSAVMFAVFNPQMVYEIEVWINRDRKTFGSISPEDASDLGRCIRMLNTFPEYRPRLDEVAKAYPHGHWPKLIARWAELEAATPERQRSILKEIYGH